MSHEGEIPLEMALLLAKRHRGESRGMPLRVIKDRICEYLSSKVGSDAFVFKIDYREQGWPDFLVMDREPIWVFCRPIDQQRESMERLKKIGYRVVSIRSEKSIKRIL